jgi:hypothetical protein
VQELKAADREFPEDALATTGYNAVWCGQKSWNGVAILARGRDPIVTRSELPGDANDREAPSLSFADPLSTSGTPSLGWAQPRGQPASSPDAEDVNFDAVRNARWRTRDLALTKFTSTTSKSFISHGTANCVVLLVKPQIFS